MKIKFNINKTINTIEDMELLRKVFGLTMRSFCQHFGLSIDQYQKWKRIGRIPKKYFKLFFSLIARNPDLIIELTNISKSIR